MLCDRFTNCLCPATPFRNLSAEAPDPVEFLAFVFVEMTPQLGDPDNFWSITDIPADCSAPVQLDAFDCAVRNGQTEITDNWRNRDGITFHMFGNHAVSCNFPCPDGAPDFVYTVPAGTVLGRTQAEADAIASSLCQERGEAAKDCTGVPLPTPAAWWDFEEAAGNFFDIINGIILPPSAPTGVITYHAVGKIDFGFGLSGTEPAFTSIDVNADTFNVAIPYAGNGFDVTFWLKVSSASNATFDLGYLLPGHTFEITYDSDAGTLTATVNVVDTVSIPYNPIDGLYHLYRLFFDPLNGEIGFQVDIGAIHSVATLVNPIASPTSRVTVFLFSSNFINPANANMVLDELAIWPRPLTPDELDQIWNNGNGTTWPII